MGNVQTFAALGRATVSSDDSTCTRKLLAGFPEAFDVVTSPERLKPDPGTYVLPTVPHTITRVAGQTPTQADRTYMRYAKHSIRSGITGSNRARSSRRHAARYMRCVSMLLTTLNVMMMPVMMILMEKLCTRQSVAGRSPASKSVCGVCGGREHYGRVEGMDCLTKQLGIHIPRSELALTKYPSGISYPFSDLPSSSAGAHKKSTHGAHLASSTSRKSCKSKRIPSKPKPKSRQPSPRRKPKHVNHVDDHDSEHVEREERTDLEDEQSSEDDPRADFAALAVTYSTIDIRHDTKHTSTDESSDDSSKYRRLRRPH